MKPRLQRSTAQNSKADSHGFKSWCASFFSESEIPKPRCKRDWFLLVNMGDRLVIAIYVWRWIKKEGTGLNQFKSSFQSNTKQVNVFNGDFMGEKLCQHEGSNPRPTDFKPCGNGVWTILTAMFASFWLITLTRTGSQEPLHLDPTCIWQSPATSWRCPRLTRIAPIFSLDYYAPL